MGTAEKLRTCEPGWRAPGPGLQLPGTRLRATAQPLRFSFHSWEQGEEQLPLGTEQC